VPKTDRIVPTALAMSHNGKTVAVGRSTDDKRGVLLYDIPSKQFKILVDGEDTTINDIAFSPDGKTLAVSYNGQGIKLWDLATEKVWQTIEEGKAGEAIGLTFSSDGAVLACGEPNLRPPAIRLWDVSKRPGSTVGVASMPKALTDLKTRDDRLAELIDEKIRGSRDPRNINALKVEILPDRTIKLTGKVSDDAVKSDAQLEAETSHDTEDNDLYGTRNKVINELQVTGKYEADEKGQKRMRGR
jgi:WD40 repeat protein